MKPEINRKLDLILNELMNLSHLIHNTHTTTSKKKYQRVIDTNTKMVTAIEALIILKFWLPTDKKKPNSRQLLPYVKNGDLRRIKIHTRYLYIREDVEKLFNSFFN